jgi:hypothetical protein
VFVDPMLHESTRNCKTSHFGPKTSRYAK